MFLETLKSKLNPEPFPTKEMIETELLFYSNMLEALWEFHPENPDKRDVVREVKDLKQRIQKLYIKLNK